MNIIIKKVGEPYEVKEIESLGLDAMQEMVGGGFIECFHVGNGVDMWINDEGKLIPLPINLAIGSHDKEILDTIHGDVFFAAGTVEGETVGLNDEQVEWVKHKLDTSEFATAFTQTEGLVFVPVWLYDTYVS